MIVVVDNFFSSKQCLETILFYKKNTDLSYYYPTNNTFPLDLLKLLDHEIFDPFLLVDNFVKKFFKNIILSNLEIVRWVEGSQMNDHIDQGDKLGVFIYLNDNYQGGHLVINETTIIKPQTGKLVFFKNGELFHKVTKVSTGNRFVLAGWYV